jgi:(R,R)-butanediol dehydrogenase/meso-butanediol dehydrogenase/diacetyl reductase
MKALRFHGRKDLRVDDVEDPASCGPHQVLVKNSYCGICGTDLHEYLHGPIQIPQKPHPFSNAVVPLILGHEFSGVVEKVGSDVQNVRPGDHVSIQPNVIPGGDYYDRRGWSHLSDNLSVVGLSYPWGGMAERCLVYDYNVAKLPPEVSDEQGAMIEPAAVAVNAIENGDLKAGDTILITGGGPIGALVGMAASAAGASKIFLSEPNPIRREFLASWNVFTGIYDPLSQDVPTLVRQETESGVGVDVAVECVGNEKALATCMDAVRRRGTVVQIGLPTRPASIDLHKLVTKDLTYRGSWAYKNTAWPKVIGLVASGKLPVEKAITGKVKLDAAVRQGFDALAAPDSAHIKILVEAPLHAGTP